MFTFRYIQVYTGMHENKHMSAVRLAIVQHARVHNNVQTHTHAHTNMQACMMANSHKGARNHTKHNLARLTSKNVRVHNTHTKTGPTDQQHPGIQER